MLRKKLTVVVVLFMLVSCGMAQKQGVETFSIKIDSLYDDNNQLNAAGNALVEKIAAKMNSFFSSCLNINHSCIHESDTICYQKLKTFVNAIIVKVPASQFFGPASEPAHMSCEDCFEFIISECPEISYDGNSPIIIIRDDEDATYSPPVIIKESEDTVGIKILDVLSKNRKIARLYKDTVMVKNNPYHIVYFIDTSEVHGINKNYYGDNFCIITQEKDLPMYNRYQVLLVSYFRHGNYFADVSLLNRVRKKIIAVDCELKGDGAGNWKVRRIKIKKGKPRK